MDKIEMLMKNVEQRIAQLEADKLIDSSKKSLLIRENKRFLVRCQQLFFSDDKTSFCSCKSGPQGRTVTADFEHQICDQCGKIAKLHQLPVVKQSEHFTCDAETKGQKKCDEQCYWCKTNYRGK